MNRKLDHLCGKLSRHGVRNLKGGHGDRAVDRRSVLVEHALNMGARDADRLGPSRTVDIQLTAADRSGVWQDPAVGATLGPTDEVAPEGGLSVPARLRWVEVGALAAIAVGTVAAAPVPGRAALAALLAMAVAPFAAEAAGLRVPASARAIVVLLALGAINIGADAWGFAVSTGQDQLGSLLLVWLVARTLATEALGLGVVVAVVAAVITSGRAAVDPGYQAALTWTAAVVAAAVVGLAGRLLIATMVELQQTQAELARSSANAERHRIAREVHDVVAHTLTITMLDITAARLAIGRNDNELALQALQEAEATGRRSLADIRRVVSLLRSDGDITGEPAATATDLRDLVSAYRTSGMEIRLEVRGDLAGMGPAAGLTLYRIAQESLANVARHAQGATVEIRVVIDGVLRLEVRSTGGALADRGGQGLGVLGMRERAHAAGGWCEAGPDDTGPEAAWVVRCEMPAGTASDTDAKVTE